MKDNVGDGVRLRDLLTFTTLDVEAVWEDIPLLMIVEDKGESPSSNIFSLTHQDVSTSVIELGNKIVSKDMLPTALIVPVAAKCDNSPAAPVKIGRTDSADVNLNHLSVSQRHAVIYPPRRNKITWQIQDLGSTNGTQVNNIQLVPKRNYHLRFLDDISIGTLSCKFMDAAALGDLIGWIRSTDDTR